MVHEAPLQRQLLMLGALRGWWCRNVVKRYYGNTVAYEANVEGARRTKVAIRALRNTTIDRRLRSAYTAHNYSRLLGLHIDKSLLEQVRTRARTLLDDPSVSPCYWKTEGRRDKAGIPRDLIGRDDYRKFLTDPRKYLPDLPSALNPEIVDAIRSCIGSNFFLEDVTITRNLHVPKAITSKFEVLSDRWHFDHQYTDGFSLFVCLSDVTEEDGPFHVIDRRDSRNVLQIGYKDALRLQSASGGLPEGTIESMHSYLRLVGPPGTMLLCHTSFCLHRAGVPEPGRFRDMLIFTFRPSPLLSVGWPVNSGPPLST